MHDELHWLTNLNLATPVIFNGVRRSGNHKWIDEPMPQTGLGSGKSHITQKELNAMNNILDPLIRSYDVDTRVYDAIKYHQCMIKADGSRLSRRTMLHYIRKLRQQLGVGKPETLEGIVINLLKAGHSISDIVVMTGGQRHYCRYIYRNAIKRGIIPDSIRKC